jgi:hypothetical protein
MDGSPRRVAAVAPALHGFLRRARHASAIRLRIGYRRGSSGSRCNFTQRRGKDPSAGWRASNRRCVDGGGGVLGRIRPGAAQGEKWQTSGLISTRPSTPASAGMYQGKVSTSRFYKVSFTPRAGIHLLQCSDGARSHDAGDPQHPAAEGPQVRSERAPGEQSWGNTGIVLEVGLLLSHAVATHGLARTIAACGAPSRSPPGFLA